MKVLALTPQYLPVMGGIEILLGMLVPRLRRHSVETVVVTDKDQFGRLLDHEVVEDTIVHRLNFRKAMREFGPTGTLAVQQQLRGILDAEKPDLIHMHSAVQHGAWYLQRVIKKIPSRPPLVITQHGGLEQSDRLAFVRDLLREADVLTGVSNAALQAAIEFSERKGYSTVIYNGIAKPDDVVRVEHSGTLFKLTCVGRLEPEKGFDTAIVALAKVRARGIDAELTIIGQGRERGPLRTLAADHDIGDHVHWEGVLHHRPTLEVIAGSSLVLVPSRSSEGFSLVTVEAALLGVPSVASRVGGIPEVVADGETGVLVAPGDSDDLARAIGDLLRNPERLRRMGMNARQRALEKFDIERCADSYAELYHDLTRPNRLLREMR